MRIYAYAFLGRLFHYLEDLRNFLKTHSVQTRHVIDLIIDADALKKNH